MFTVVSVVSIEAVTMLKGGFWSVTNWPERSIDSPAASGTARTSIRVMSSRMSPGVPALSTTVTSEPAGKVPAPLLVTVAVKSTTKPRKSFV